MFYGKLLVMQESEKPVFECSVQHFLQHFRRASPLATRRLRIAGVMQVQIGGLQRSESAFPLG
jgi:hypothetical protein